MTEMLHNGMHDPAVYRALVAVVLCETFGVASSRTPSLVDILLVSESLTQAEVRAPRSWRKMARDCGDSKDEDELEEDMDDDFSFDDDNDNDDDDSDSNDDETYDSDGDSDEDDLPSDESDSTEDTDSEKDNSED